MQTLNAQQPDCARGSPGLLSKAILRFLSVGSESSTPSAPIVPGALRGRASWNFFLYKVIQARIKMGVEGPVKRSRTITDEEWKGNAQTDIYKTQAQAPRTQC
jgi:hypothetical protein